MNSVHISHDPDLVAQNVAAAMAEMIQRDVPFHLALSGGSTPRRLFEYLAKHYRDSIPWGSVHLWWGDERCVPPRHEDSNYRMTKESLLSGVIIPPDNVHRILGENPPAQEAERYAMEMRKYMPMEAGLPKFDLIMLGLGEDGHTASIFPHQMELIDTDAWTAVAAHPDSGQQRISLTGRVINQAEAVFFLVTGAGKAERVVEILEDHEGSERYPARHIHPASNNFTWYLDRAAATKLRF